MSSREQTQLDIHAYHRRIKLAVHFEDRDESECPPFTPRSTWVPPEGLLPHQVGDLVRADLHHLHKDLCVFRVPPNLEEFELEALAALRANKHIILKPADKGSATIIMDREQYVWEAYRQLGDPNYYSRLEKPIFRDTVPLVEKIVRSLVTKKFINFKQMTYLLGEGEPRARLFYMLPKIHKEPSKWSKPFEIPPGRPIVSDCGSETYFTAEYIDYYLNPLSIRHASYIKDTFDFVAKIKQLNIPVDAFLFTMDVDSLYTNIDILEGIQAVKNIFRKFPNNKRPDKELLQLLDINLTRNDFEFDNKYFLQIKGTAMGKKFAPAYADIFMAQWETSALAACEKKPLHYFRYLDDIWGVWPHSREDFDVFCTFLNNHNPSIKIKSTFSHSSVDFLDTCTFKGHDFIRSLKLDIRVFFKETDTHALLVKTSFHPRHTYAGLVKSQLLRFQRICTRQADFLNATKVLFSALSTRGYSRSFLRGVLKTFNKINPITTDSLLPFITTYSPTAVKLVRTIKANFHSFLAQNNLLRDFRIIAAFRKNKNLQDILVKAKLPPLGAPKPSGHGSFFRTLVCVRNKQNNNVFPVQKGVSAKSSNCVYLIWCKSCGAQYVGETGNTILTRFTQHRYNICKVGRPRTPLVNHFLLHGWHNLVATVLEMNPRWSVAQRRRAERLWIIKLGTLQPFGLNERAMGTGGLHTGPCPNPHPQPHPQKQRSRRWLINGGGWGILPEVEGAGAGG